MRARVTTAMIASMREMRARNRTYACIGRLHGVSTDTARNHTLDVPAKSSGTVNAERAAREGMRHRALYYQRLVARVARVMPEAVR